MSHQRPQRLWGDRRREARRAMPRSADRPSGWPSRRRGGGGGV